MLAVGAADETHICCAVAEGCFVDGEALLLPVVAGDYPVTDGLFEKMNRVLVVDLGTCVATVVEETARIGGVGHGGRR